MIARAAAVATRIRLTPSEAVKILRPYILSRLAEQLRALLPVVTYLFIFEGIVLRRTIADAALISAALGCAVLGLMLFMEGLRLWLLPLGETIGRELPRRSSLTAILAFAFLVGVLVTLAEPALGALQAAGGMVDVHRAPLLHAILGGRSTGLAAAVALSVGLAVVLSILRFLAGWSIKLLVTPMLILAGALTIWAGGREDLGSVIGLVWDLGAVVVGPITVPLVLGLGLGVCRSTGKAETGMSGFGTAALISLMPILAGFIYAMIPAGSAASPEAPWTPGMLGGAAVEVLLSASQAILPLSALLFFVQFVVMRERLANGDEVALGLAFALIGLIFFNLGIQQGLAPLGAQVGSVTPAAFMKIVAGDPPASFGPLYGAAAGKGVVIAFAFLLGYGATLAEPALSALGTQVDEVTVGAFRKPILLHTVAIGVGAGMAAGIARIIFDWPLVWLLMLAYVPILILTLLSTEEFASIGWDAGAVTTGPVTVPLVVALGLGIGQRIPGVVEGFGILSLATAGPTLTVLAMGLLVRRPKEAP